MGFRLQSLRGDGQRAVEFLTLNLRKTDLRAGAGSGFLRQITGDADDPPFLAPLGARRR